MSEIFDQSKLKGANDLFSSAYTQGTKWKQATVDINGDNLVDDKDKSVLINSEDGVLYFGDKASGTYSIKDIKEKWLDMLPELQGKSFEQMIKHVVLDKDAWTANEELTVDFAHADNVNAGTNIVVDNDHLNTAQALRTKTNLNFQNRIGTGITLDSDYSGKAQGASGVETNLAFNKDSSISITGSQDVVTKTLSSETSGLDIQNQVVVSQANGLHFEGALAQNIEAEIGGTTTIVTNKDPKTPEVVDPTNSFMLKSTGSGTFNDNGFGIKQDIRSTIGNDVPFTKFHARNITQGVQEGTYGGDNSKVIQNIKLDLKGAKNNGGIGITEESGNWVDNINKTSNTNAVIDHEGNLRTDDLGGLAAAAINETPAAVTNKPPQTNENTVSWKDILKEPGLMNMNVQAWDQTFYAVTSEDDYKYLVSITKGQTINGKVVAGVETYDHLGYKITYTDNSTEDVMFDRARTGGTTAVAFYDPDTMMLRVASVEKTMIYRGVYFDGTIPQSTSTGAGSSQEGTSGSEAPDSTGGSENEQPPATEEPPAVEGSSQGTSTGGYASQAFGFSGITSGSTPAPEPTTTSGPVQVSIPISPAAANTVQEDPFARLRDFLSRFNITWLRP